MQKYILILFSTIYVSSLSYANVCDQIYQEMQPKLEELKKVVACGSGFTATECRENLGYAAGGIAATVAVAAGFKAGRHMIFNVPKACGMRGADNFIFDLFFPFAYASCNSPTTALAAELDGILDDDLKIKKYQVVKELQNELEKDTKVTAALAEYEKIKEAYYGNKAQQDSVAGRLKDFKAKYGIDEVLFDNPNHCKGNPSFCAKFRTLRVLRSPVDATNKAIAYYDEIYDIFKNNPEFKDKFDAVKKVQALRNKIAKGAVKTTEELVEFYSEVKASIHVGFHERYATAVARALKVFPNLESLKKMAASLGESFASFITEKKLGKVKFTLPAILGVLIATGASAAECSEQNTSCQKAKKAIEDGVALADAASDPEQAFRIKSVGCAEIYSEYSTPKEDCKDSPAFTGKMKTFLLADQDIQKKELCRSSRFKVAVQTLFADTYPGNMSITCNANGVTLRNPRQDTTTQFTFNNDVLVKTQVSGKFEDNYGYDLNFNSDGTIGMAKINTQRGGRTGFYFDQAKIKKSDAIDTLTEDLATRMPTAFASWEKCKMNPNLSNASPTQPTNSGRQVK
jgi:hypothetical protein